MRLYASAFLPVAFISLPSGQRPMGKVVNGFRAPKMPMISPRCFPCCMTRMPEGQRKQAIEEYILEFVVKTNDGRVFTADSSMLNTGQNRGRTKMTVKEINYRQYWASTRSDLQEHYHQKHRDFDLALGDLSPEEVLLLRVAAPLLNDRVIASRGRFTDVRSRLYLDELHAWKDFEKGARSFTVPAVAEGTRIDGDVLYDSLKLDKYIDNESDEATYLVDHVLVTLQKAGLLQHGSRNDALDRLRRQPRQRQPRRRQARSLQQSKQTTTKSKPVLGNADHFLMAGGNTTVPIEFKTTHSLLLPEKADEVMLRYCNAIEEVKATQNIRDTDLTNIGNPLAQLMSSMFVGKSRYGVLSSGTRSYFLKVFEDTDDDPRVLITDAWFIGQPDYLRAWSYFYHLAKGNGNFQPPDGWWKKWTMVPPASTQDRDQPGRRKGTKGRDRADDSTKPPSKSRKRDDQDSRTESPPTERSMRWLDPRMAPSIPRVDGMDIRFVRLLDAGNSAVYLALWKGKKVAVKVFDFYQDLDWFENEIRAYEHLKDTWGVLVPKPYFIADWFGFVLLGMQLGRSPNRRDSKFESELDNLSRTLQRDYGFDHLDLHDGNVIYLPDKSGKGKAHLVAIDLEGHEVRPASTIGRG